MEDSFDSSQAIDKQRLKALSRRSDAKGLLQLASHLLALTASGALVVLAGWSPWLLPAMALHGLLLIFLFAPLHETVHRTAFASRWLNDLVAWPCGLVLMLPPEYFRAFHFAHHRHTQDPARDPELRVPKPATRGAYLRRLTGLPYWRERIATIPAHACGRVEAAFLPARLHGSIVREARAVVAVWIGLAGISIATGSAAVLTLWLLPALLGQPFLRAYLLSEHTGCPHVPDMLRNTRTTRSTAFVRWLAWNMPYHVEHHAYPAVPFHALPAAHEVIKDRIAFLAPGYIAVQREIVADLDPSPTAPASG